MLMLKRVCVPNQEISTVGPLLQHVHLFEQSKRLAHGGAGDAKRIRELLFCQMFFRLPLRRSEHLNDLRGELRRQRRRFCFRVAFLLFQYLTLFLSKLPNGSKTVQRKLPATARAKAMMIVLCVICLLLV
jgi:hypothetical protein